jgi:aspartate/methionine/tyrosine aminotransferase
LKFSSRLDWTLAPNPLARLLAAKRAAGEPILDLTESNPTHAGIEYPAEEIADGFAGARLLEYEPDPAGSLAVREAVAGYYNGAASADRILLTASTSEAYAYLFKLLCDQGDEVLVPRPSYPLFDYLARLESVHVRQYPLFYDHGWHIDLHALATTATDRTRAVVVVNPNNPTGHFLKARAWSELAVFCQQRGLAVISDEVFADYGHEPDGDRIEFLAGNPPVLTFSLSGLSKTVGLPQMKLGWIVLGGPETAAAWSRLELIADTYLSVSTPVQVAAPRLLALRGDIQSRIRARLAANLEELRAQLGSEPAVQALRIEGGWYATLQVPRTRTEEEWALALLRDANVLVQPGYFYDFETEAFLVLSLLTETSVFAEGLSRMLAVLRHR